MVKQFAIPCIFGGSKQMVTLFIGAPNSDYHPLHFQSNWLSNEKGGQIPQDVMDSIARLRDLAVQNKVSFEELCYYAINVANGSIPNNHKQFAKIISDG